MYADSAIVLTVSQFKRFMEVIKKLGDRVEKEHDQYLRDSQRIEDRSAVNGRASLSNNPTGAVDFESLVGNNAAAPAPKADGASANAGQSWEDDVWGSIFSSNPSVSLRSVCTCTFADEICTDTRCSESCVVATAYTLAAAHHIHLHHPDTVIAVVTEGLKLAEPSCLTISPWPPGTRAGCNACTIHISQSVDVPSRFVTLSFRSAKADFHTIHGAYAALIPRPCAIEYSTSISNLQCSASGAIRPELQHHPSNYAADATYATHDFHFDSSVLRITDVNGWSARSFEAPTTSVARVHRRTKAALKG